MMTHSQRRLVLITETLQRAEPIKLLENCQGQNYSTLSQTVSIGEENTVLIEEKNISGLEDNHANP